MKTRNPAILETTEPYLVAAPWQVERLDRAPMGVSIPDGNVIDPTRLSAAPFLDRLVTLDGLTFGPEGMPMPRWIFYSGAEITGAIFGFARRAETLPDEVRERLDPERDATSLVPLSMYIALPMRPPDLWFGHNLASLNPQFPDLGLGGLATITKAIGLRAFRCREQIGATQWASGAMHIHARFGALELLTAWTPAHSEPATLTYRVDVSERSLRSALGDSSADLPRPEADFEIGTHNETAQRELHDRIEHGERFVITDRPHRDPDDRMVVPIASIPSTATAAEAS